MKWHLKENSNNRVKITYLFALFLFWGTKGWILLLRAGLHVTKITFWTGTFVDIIGSFLFLKKIFLPLFNKLDKSFFRWLFCTFKFKQAGHISEDFDKNAVIVDKYGDTWCVLMNALYIDTKAYGVQDTRKKTSFINK